MKSLVCFVLFVVSVSLVLKGDCTMCFLARDDDGELEEALKPKLTFNPYLQRLYQSLQHRVLHPKEPLPQLSPIIADYLKPPREVITRCTGVVEKAKTKFKLTEVVKKEEKEAAEKVFKDK